MTILPRNEIQIEKLNHPSRQWIKPEHLFSNPELLEDMQTSMRALRKRPAWSSEGRVADGIIRICCTDGL